MASHRTGHAGLVADAGPHALETALRTAAALVVLPAGICVLGSLATAAGLLGVAPPRAHGLYRAFGRLCIAVGGTRLEIHGRRHLEPGHAYVVVPNHESNWDPVVLLAGLPELVLRFVAKREVMRLPVLGRALRATGNLEVVRTGTGQDVHSINRSMRVRHPEVSVLFFAEGTRTRDGSLGPFKKGAFAAALAHGLPVLPVAIAGTRGVWLPGRLRLRRGRAVVEVGKPIPVEGLGHEDRDALRDRTWQAVARLRDRARGRLAAE